jgi:UDP-glucose 4-epimerase
MSQDILVTGSSGFIGSQLSELVAFRANAQVSGLDIVDPKTLPNYDFAKADIGDRPALKTLPCKPGVIVHLAAKAEVVFPFNELANLVTTNETGTINILDIFQPHRCVFASSSAVYGTSGAEKIAPDWENVNPIGAYGMSKAMGELICGDWARETGGVAVMFRFGNVIGRNCRGLIPYLVNHAKKYPDGSVPAQARGQGQIVRDYVPVNYTIKILMMAMEAEFAPGTALALNIGTGRPMTNGEVGAIAQRILLQEGYALNINWNHPIPQGESKCVILDMEKTVATFGVPVPTEDEVLETIEMAVRSHL